MIQEFQWSIDEFVMRFIVFVKLLWMIKNIVSDLIDWWQDLLYVEIIMIDDKIYDMIDDALGTSSAD